MTPARTVGLLLALAVITLPADDRLSADPPTPTPKGKKVALVIGVNEYTNRNLDNLKYAEADATAFAEVLKTNGFEVRVLLGSGTDKSAATRDNILAAVQDALRGVGKRDTVVLAFAGHGQQEFVKNKDKPGERVVPFFCPVDAVPSDTKTLISLSDVLTDLNERGGGINLLLVDACRNLTDPTRGVRGGIDGDHVEKLKAGTAAFFSCSSGQRARETEKAGSGHGVFFYFVIEGLKGAAMNDAGEVTWDRLTAHVKSRVREVGPQWFGFLKEGELQTPHALQNLSGDPVLAIRPAGETTRSSFFHDVALDKLPENELCVLKKYDDWFRSLQFVRGNRRLVGLIRGNGETTTKPDDPLTTRPALVVWDTVTKTELHRWTIRSGVA